jgi:hypothetical protein
MFKPQGVKLQMVWNSWIQYKVEISLSIVDLQVVILQDHRLVGVLSWILDASPMLFTTLCVCCVLVSKSL